MSCSRRVELRLHSQRLDNKGYHWSGQTAKASDHTDTCRPRRRRSVNASAAHGLQDQLICLRSPGLTSAGGEEKVVLINATYLKAHRTASSLRAKEWGPATSEGV